MREAVLHLHKRPRQAGLQDAPCHGRHDKRGLEEEFDLFRTVTKEANRIFNYEEFGITTLFTYLRIPIKRLVALLNVNSTNVQADISRVVHQFSCPSSASGPMRSSSL